MSVKPSSLINANGKAILDRMLELKEEGKSLKELIDYRPDGKGQIVDVCYYSYYEFDNAAGGGNRVVAHLDPVLCYPMIVKLDSQGNLAIDIDCAREMFDARGKGGIKAAYALSDNYSQIALKELGDEISNYRHDKIQVTIADKDHGKKASGGDNISVEVPV